VAAVTGPGANDGRTQETIPTSWDHEADVVVIGSGATGLPAAVAAAEAGASVIIVEANWDIGGHAALSGGNVALGGGTSRQKQYGIVDSPDLVFADLTDWSIVEANGAADYRYNDREVIRAFADHSAPTYEWLVEHGVVFIEGPVDNRGAGATGNSALRENHVAAMAWVQFQNGKSQPPERQATTSTGIGLVRPLEEAARKLGVQILLQHRMTSIIRQERKAGPVLGITATHEGRTVNIRARRGVVIATGGSSGNVNFRRMFDPRLTEEYCGVAGEPYSFQDASGELAALDIGASLWGTANFSGEFGSTITKAGRIGTQYGYRNLAWQPTSPVFHLVRAVGLRVEDWQNVILVNMIGKRFYDETVDQYVSNNYEAVRDYVYGSWRNAANVKYNPRNFLNAALAGIGDGSNGGGPIWAIFDADAVQREGWTPEPPYVDFAEGFFFKADTIAELAASIKNKYQRVPMPPSNLEETVARYNSFVDSGVDEDFDKPTPQYKIQTPPFYAAWSTPVVHDTRAGLRINGKCQVVDFDGNVIPGLYCGGESAGGFSMHGLARCVVQGRLAGMNAANDGDW
jgi:succinate dehydrogenase/fumarate reductase flavoprotein subunit